MNNYPGSLATSDDLTTNTDDHSKREFVLKVWFGASVLLTAIGLGLTLWGTVYHPAGYGNSSPTKDENGENIVGIDSRTVIAGLLCLAFGAMALSIFCWYTKCCNTNGLPDYPGSTGGSGDNGSYDDGGDVPKHIPPPLPGLLITQTFGPVQPGTIANLTPPQIHKLASTPTDEAPAFPPPSSLLTPRGSFNGLGSMPMRSPRGSFSGVLPHSPRHSGLGHQLPSSGLPTQSNTSSNRPISPIQNSPRISAGQHCFLRSPVKPGTISNLTPPQIHKLATTPTDDTFKHFQGLHKSKDKYLTPGYQHSTTKRTSSPVPCASAENSLAVTPHSRRSSYCSMKGEFT